MTDRGRTVTAHCPSRAAALWRVIADVPGVASWSDEIERSAWTNRACPDQVTQGDRFESFVRLGSLTWTSPGTVTAVALDRLLELTIGDPASPVAVWSFELEQRSRGTDLTYWVELGAGKSMLAPIARGDGHLLMSLEQGRLDSLALGMARTIDRIVKTAARA